ncbi:hypothetical protein [uncultured Chitinophaga sp.]|jgi:hypothetical protein|uniref:BP74-related protein n=1 Tax=uncultured Chitinophaga sp. TaxID=339340 RepID=UPI002620EE43|nr:hypothetical protein [uncultured Chitinophaga sp.]
MLRLCVLSALLFTMACSDDPAPGPALRYYEVGFSDFTDEREPGGADDWRDTSFIVATADTQLIRKITEQLAQPVAQRQIVNGALAPGNGGYNHNAAHNFKWHFKEDDWHLTDMSAEALDGRPYSDVDLHNAYWLDTVKRFSPWHSYIKNEITP